MADIWYQACGEAKAVMLQWESKLAVAVSYHPAQEWFWRPHWKSEVVEDSVLRYDCFQLGWFKLKLQVDKVIEEVNRG